MFDAAAVMSCRRLWCDSRIGCGAAQHVAAGGDVTGLAIQRMPARQRCPAARIPVERLACARSEGSHPED